MFRLPDNALASYPRQTRDELAAAWDHLMTAAEHGARQVGQTSRRRGRVARDRAALARLALRGDLPAAQWRWLGTGLAAGLVVGAVGATVLARRNRDADRAVTDQAQAGTATIREKAGAGAVTVREGTTAAVHSATTAARDAAAKVRERVTHRNSAGGVESPSPSESAGRPSSGASED